MKFGEKNNNAPIYIILLCMLAFFFLLIDFTYYNEQTITGIVDEIEISSGGNKSPSTAIIYLSDSGKALNYFSIDLALAHKLEKGEKVEIVQSIYLRRTVELKVKSKIISQRFTATNIFAFFALVIAAIGFVGGVVTNIRSRLAANKN